MSHPAQNGNRRAQAKKESQPQAKKAAQVPLERPDRRPRNLAAAAARFPHTLNKSGALARTTADATLVVEAEEDVVPLGDAVRATGAAFEEHTYPGSGHLFADPDLPEYDRASSEEMWERVLGFLDRIDARGSDVERGAR